MLAYQLIARPGFVDFQVYHEAGRKAFDHHTVYDVTTIDQFKYAPFVALIFGVFFHGTARGSAGLAFAVCMTGMWAILVRRWTLPARIPFALVLPFFAPSIATDIAMGQVNALALLLLTLGFEHLDEDRAWKTGVFWGLALQLKLYAVLAFPILLFRGDWRRIAVILTCFSSCNFLLVPLAHGWGPGLSECWRWAETLTTSTDDLILNRDNISLLGVSGKWLHSLGSVSPWLPRCAWSAVALGFLFVQWRWRRQQAWWLLAWSLIGILVLNPLAWSYWLAVLLPAFGLGLSRLAEAGRWRLLLAIAILSLQPLTFIDQALVHRGASLLLAGAASWMLLSHRREFLRA